ncbi:two-component system C4-dicarboxylate transport response regulator DctD [Aliiruegeria haliotis]|uniref:Two-component system C4-dicarboxylate transport response regulator DctD n=1 Tax=Aliiruegeria haliotis TaxID=1280846 RepID=A0A2T0RYV3_9RHOB|nr:sigma-54 dependent transcriptional regulator [Aliiruegeria haliotis]PRY26369.1 two-component system C4-dicarboxylate transport response regulator DctD [Aliiruegeria haliotis]
MTDRVLVVDDDASVREALGQTLELADLRPVTAGSYIEAKDHVSPEFGGVVVTDIRMPGKDGFALLDWVQKVDEDLPVILLTGEGDVPMAVKAMSNGAFDFLEKPCESKVLLSVVHKALAARELVMENRRLKRELASGDAAARMLRGTSPQSEALRARVRLVARSGAEVLVTGPLGSGTAKVAEVVHLVSSAAPHPFVKRSAAALTPEALEDACDAAGSGTLFLDEVTTLGPATQLALLDRLDTGAEPRVIAGTYRDLDAEVEAGRFSADLAMRLDMLRVAIPPLNERKEDIAPLFRHYVALACEQANLPEPEISPEVIARLMAQDWPGNARSLMNAAMRFAMGVSDPAPAEELGLAEQMTQVERTLLIAALEKAEGRAVQAAEALKLPRKTFYDKLARHGLRAEDYRKV